MRARALSSRETRSDQESRCQRAREPESEERRAARNSVSASFKLIIRLVCICAMAALTVNGNSFSLSSRIAFYPVSAGVFHTYCPSEYMPGIRIRFAFILNDIRVAVHDVFFFTHSVGVTHIWIDVVLYSTWAAALPPRRRCEWLFFAIETRNVFSRNHIHRNVFV